jgi:hypothetical protein
MEIEHLRAYPQDILAIATFKKTLFDTKITMKSYLD